MLRSSELEAALWRVKYRPPDLGLRRQFYWGRGIFRCNKAFKTRSFWIRVAPNLMTCVFKTDRRGDTDGEQVTEGRGKLPP